MRQILLLTDFSDCALNAIFVAIKLQQKNPCNFILLHTYRLPEENHAATINLEKSLQAISKVSDCSQNEFSIQSICGDLASVLRDFIPKYDLDLIIIGATGNSGAEEIFLGSNVVHVLNKIRNCPILVVPQKYNFQSLGKIVLPTEYTHFFSKGQLRSLLSLAETWRSQILIVHVAKAFELSENQIANKNILNDRIGDIPHSFHTASQTGTVAKTIEDFASHQSADMICLVKYSHTFIKKLVQENVVRKVDFHTEIPLLVLPE
ncbi:hypothetical protein LCGC14_1656820 [marine sediment metagenome]|uniref:UspA domain-containing protein n=1 Tax=marine sediment metagenome TaxID=412755 RepID=A0A0F9KVC6_9ZZZZ